MITRIWRWLFPPPPPDLCSSDMGEHDYDNIKTVTMPSKYDMMVPGTQYSPGDWTLFTRKLVMTFKCKKCGKLYVHTETNG